MKPLRILMLILLFGVAGPGILRAGEVFQSGEQAPALLELYSAKDCKECPDAENWVAGFKSRPDLWKTFIPVVFRVQYGTLTEEDPLRARDHDLRLSQYLESWKSTAMILPLLVLDGKSLRSPEDLWNQLNVSRPSEGALTIKQLDAQEFLIYFKPLRERFTMALDIYGVILGFRDPPTPPSLEEGGPPQAFTVLSFRKKTVQQENGSYSSSIILPTKSIEGYQGLAAAFWVTEQGSVKSLQAAGGWIETAAERPGQA